MKRYYPRAGTAAAVFAVQWTGENLDDVLSFLLSFAPTIELFTAAETPISQRLLIAAPDFPFWLTKGEWLTCDQGAELDGWPDAHFRETYTHQIERAAT